MCRRVRAARSRCCPWRTTRGLAPFGATYNALADEPRMAALYAPLFTVDAAIGESTRTWARAAAVQKSPDKRLITLPGIPNPSRPASVRPVPACEEKRSA